MQYNRKEEDLVGHYTSMLDNVTILFNRLPIIGIKYS